MNLKYLDYKVIDYNFGFFPLVIFNESLYSLWSWCHKFFLQTIHSDLLTIPRHIRTCKIQLACISSA